MKDIIVDVNGKTYNRFVEVRVDYENNLGKFELELNKNGEIDFTKKSRVKLLAKMFAMGFVSGAKDPWAHLGAGLGTAINIVAGEVDLRELLIGYVRGILMGATFHGVVNIVDIDHRIDW